MVHLMFIQIRFIYINIQVNIGCFKFSATWYWTMLLSYLLSADAACNFSLNQSILFWISGKVLSLKIPSGIISAQYVRMAVPEWWIRFTFEWNSRQNSKSRQHFIHVEFRLTQLEKHEQRQLNFVRYN